MLVKISATIWAAVDSGTSARVLVAGLTVARCEDERYVRRRCIRVSTLLPHYTHKNNARLTTRYNGGGVTVRKKVAATTVAVAAGCSVDPEGEEGKLLRGNE